MITHRLLQLVAMGLGGKYVIVFINISVMANPHHPVEYITMIHDVCVCLLRAIAAICTAYAYSCRRFSSGQPDLLLLRIRRYNFLIFS